VSLITGCRSIGRIGVTQAMAFDSGGASCFFEVNKMSLRDLSFFGELLLEWEVLGLVSCVTTPAAALRESDTTLRDSLHKATNCLETYDSFFPPFPRSSTTHLSTLPLVIQALNPAANNPKTLPILRRGLHPRGSVLPARPRLRLQRALGIKQIPRVLLPEQRRPVHQRLAAPWALA
jgi:hypothetical protein